MPKPPLSADAEKMFVRPNYATMSTLRPDGQPVSVATWYLYENRRVLVNMDARRKRVEHLGNDPRVSLTALDPDDWFTHLSIVGMVVQLVDDADLVDIDRIARHYTGDQYGVRGDPRISVWIEIDRWFGWGALRQN
ncbi:MAG TPA: TIGR03618 family F420-dependent PPOX class oxidoreductase [Aldersonia sp.]